MSVQNDEMPDDYSWLDADRAATEIYVDRVHSACKCMWDLDKRSPESPATDLPAMKLIARRKACPIHGLKGEI